MDEGIMYFLPLTENKICTSLGASRILCGTALLRHRG